MSAGTSIRVSDDIPCDRQMAHRVSYCSRIRREIHRHESGQQQRETICRRLSITDGAYRRIMAIFVSYPHGRSTRLLFTRGVPILSLFLSRPVVRSTAKPSSFRNLTHPQPRPLVALTLCTGHFPRLDFHDIHDRWIHRKKIPRSFRSIMCAHKGYFRLFP